MPRLMFKIECYVTHYSNILENKSWLVKCTVVNHHKTSVENKRNTEMEPNRRLGRTTRRTSWTLGRINCSVLIWKNKLLSILVCTQDGSPFLVFVRDGL